MRNFSTLIRFIFVFTFFLFGHFAIYAQDTHTDIVPNGAVAKKLSNDQYSFTEGPVWYNDSILLFTSYSARDYRSKIYSYNPIDNKIGIFRDPIGANGLTCDKDGNLLSTHDHSVVMLDKKGATIKTLADTYNGKVFTSPNDLIADNKGGIYFTDLFIFGSPIQDKDAVYYVDSTGEVKRIIEDNGANGVILSPDGKKLYISGGKEIYSYDVAPDGSVSGQSVFAELQTINGTDPGSDGMAIDIYGNLYVSSNEGVQIFSSKGAYITYIAIPKGSLNCDFGGKDFKTLYITQFNSLYSIDLNYQGFAVSRENNFPDAVDPITEQALIKIFPNPVTEMLYVHHKLGKLHSIDLLTIEGKKASLSFIKQDEADFSINTQNLIPGLYLLRLTHQQGNTTMMFQKK